MASEDPHPFIDNGAYFKDTNGYVQFPSQSDAMLASLQLFHEVPCRIMNLIISTVTHPDFDAKQVTLKSSVDVIQITEEARLHDRMAVVHRRSLNVDGQMEQTDVPQFVLYQVLDIVHERRQETIRRMFERTMDDYSQFNERIPEDDVLSNMSLVHRSWTFPAQQTLGRIICIRKAIENVDALFQRENRAIYGPWTSTVAIVFVSLKHTYVRDLDREVIEFGLLKKFEALHRLLLSLSNPRRIYIRSYLPLLTEWTNFTFREMVRQTAHLEELVLQTLSQIAFNLDPMFENEIVSDSLQSLSIGGVSLSDKARNSILQSSNFALPHLRSLSFGNSSWTRYSVSGLLLALLSILSARSSSYLSSFTISHGLTITAVERDLSPRQCISLFERLSTLRIDSMEAHRWLKWIGPYCSSLETIELTMRSWTYVAGMLSPLPITTQCLNLRIREANIPVHLACVGYCAKELLGIARSTHHSALKVITFSVPCAKRMEYPTDVQEPINFYEAKMQEFLAEMDAVCREAGIRFEFSWAEQCVICDDPGSEEEWQDD